MTTPRDVADEQVDQLARAVLYEGYILWPYRRSALKNQRRWTLGAVLPCAWTERGHDDDSCELVAECLLELPGSGGPEVEIEVSARFLHVVERRVARVDAESLRDVESLEVAGRRWLPWDEAVEREVVIERFSPLRDPPTVRVIAVPAASMRESIASDGGPAGALVRSWRELRGEVRVSASRPAPGICRLSIAVRNTSPLPLFSARDDALRQAFVSLHVVVRATGGAFVSMTDPPEPLREAAAACRNVGCWPVLAGPRGRRDVMLAAPIILPDHAGIARESPGDLFDGGEIDELLSLNILALTEHEQREMRETDPRARAILERTLALGAADWARMHGRAGPASGRDG